MTDEWDDYESGPFCRHWSEWGDCDEVCAACGHGCGSHEDDAECIQCDCPGWKEKDD